MVRGPLGENFNASGPRTFNTRTGGNINGEELTLDRAPVWRLRWNPRSRLCRCRKTFLATWRIECCDTLAKTALRNSLKPAAPHRAIPSGEAAPQNPFRYINLHRLLAVRWLLQHEMGLCDCVQVFFADKCLVYGMTWWTRWKSSEAIQKLLFFR